MNNYEEAISAAKFIYGLFCFVPRGPFSFSCTVLFPVALLSLSFSLPHLSFQTYSRGVRFLQLVHISNPHFTRTPLSAPHLSLGLSFLLSLLLYLTLTPACLGWPWGLQGSERGGLILTHSCNASHLLHSLFLCCKHPFLLILLPSLILNSPCHLCQISPPTSLTSSPKLQPQAPPPPSPNSILVSATLNNSIMLSPCGYHGESV